MTTASKYITFEVGEGLVVARQNGHRVFVMNHSARFIWEKRAEGITEAEIPQLVAMHYSIDLEQANRDFRNTLRYWQAQGLARSPGHSCHYSIGDVNFRVHYTDAKIGSALSSMLRHLESDDSHPDFPMAEFDIELEEDLNILVRENGAEVLRSSDLDDVVAKVAHSVVMCAYEHVSWLLAIHAGAVGSRAACVLMPGASRTGKSTLTAWLLSSRRNYYLGDDIVLLDRVNMRAVPVPGALVLKKGSWEALSAMLPDLCHAIPRRRFDEAVRYWAPPAAQVVKAPLPVKAVIFTRFERGQQTALTRLTMLQGLSEIVAAPSKVRGPLTVNVIEQLLSWASAIPFYTLTYGSLAEAGHMIEELLWS
jgi:hypothetical protein